MENKDNKNYYTEQLFLNTIKDFKNIKNLNSEIQNIQKKYINIPNFKDREFIKFMYLKYAILTFYLNNKNANVMKDFNNGDKKYFLPEFIGIINNLKELNKSIDDYYNENDKQNIIKIEENCFFNNCQTDTIEIIEDNKEVYTTSDLNDIFSSTDKKNNDILENLISMLNIKFENVDVLNKQITSLINSKILIPISDEFMIINNVNVATGNIENINNPNKRQNVRSDIILNDFFNHINKTDHSQDLIINQIEILKTLSKYETKYKSENIDIQKNLSILKSYFNSIYLNYSNNTNFLNYSNHKNNFISFRKAKLNNSKLIFRECLRDQNIILSGFCFVSDKKLNIGDNNKITLEDLKKLLNDDLLKSKNTFEREWKNYIVNNKKLDNRYYYFFNQSDPTSEIIELYNFIFDKIKDKKIVSLFDCFDYLPEWYVESNPLNGSSKELKYNKDLEIDKNELIMYGMNENKIKLPDYNLSEKEKLKSSEVIKINNQNSVCQHIIDKRELEELKRNKNLVKYESQSYEYVKKYVMTDFNGNKICKSCSEKIDVSGIISGNSIDSDISYGGLMNYKNLDQIAEYSKYGKTDKSDGLINNMDSIISDLGNILNLKLYSGFSNQQINLRKKIIKDIIDIISHNKKIITIEYKDIKMIIPNIIKKYNINNVSNNNFYIFNLDNSIYETTKQDIYQVKKRNNIIYYILFNFLINLNEQNLYDILTKKILLIKGSKNIYQDYKNHKKIFDGIKIMVKGQTSEIKNYDVLCFCLYLFSRILSQEKYKSKIILDVEYKQISIQAQLIIIFSLITLINITMECVNYINKNKTKFGNIEIQIWDNIQIRFNNQIDNFFNKSEILTSYFYDNKKVEDVKDREIIKFEEIDKIKDKKYLNGEKYKDDKKNIMDGGITITYNDYNTENQDLQNYKYVDLGIKNNNDIFHNFVFDPKLKSMVCKDCGLLFSDYIKTKKDKKPINDLIFLQYMKNRIKNYCPDGTVHDIDLKTGECKKCGYKPGKIYTEDQIIQLYKNLSKGVITENNKTLIFEENNKVQSQETGTRKRRVELNKTTLNQISNLIKNIIGEYFDIDEKQIKLDQNVYKLNYSYNNDVYQPPKLFIPETGKLEHRRVYKYIEKDLIVFYNYHTLQPIAYQISKTLTNLKNTEIKNQQNLIIEYSLINMIQNLFNKQKFIIFNKEEEIENYILNFNDAIKNFKIKFIRYLQKIINGIVLKNDKDIQDINQVLELNELYFDIRQFYGKINIKDLNKLFKEDDLIFNFNDNQEIKLNKIYDCQKINEMIKIINIKLTNLYNDLLKIIKENNNKIFIDFFLNFIYYYFKNNTEFYKINDQQIIIFNNVITSQFITIMDKTKINNNAIIEELENNEELNEKIKDINLNDKEYEEKERRKEEEKDEQEGYDIDYDVDNEDDIEYEDNDK